ncbi:hypothetical protein BC834DRAFT_157744 [Gloeopeniophorella convolvens]|nr:hypothetical protein BC834DRAFT_157744 [Gloeopeniophorella convolvens]
MSTSPVLAATTVLGKRKASRPYVLHLSGTSGAEESEYEPPAQTTAGPSRRPVLVNGKLVLDSKRIYQCTFERCDKSYTKPSRLEEHERSHTGDRPFVCTKCDKSYLRETHLQAHARSHLPKSDRPFACEESDCDKRFWTAQHLHAHQEVIHFGEKPFKCTYADCEAAFLKHHKLRAHLANKHAPLGTKSYQCEHEGCPKSFDTNQKLRAHLKVHEEKRYTCALATCRAAAESTFFQTWTALQHHIRTDHPPTCPHEECAGRTFSAQKGLRAHLRLHEQKALDAVLDDEHDSSDEDEDAPSRKRRRGGEAGRDWKCEVEGCTKDFKSVYLPHVTVWARLTHNMVQKKALTNHHSITHLGQRNFICTEDGCKRAFGYKHILQRHQARVHGHGHGHGHDGASDEDDGDEHADGESSEAEQPAPKKRKPRHVAQSAIDEMTGVAYAERTTVGASGQVPLKCPHPAMEGLPVPASEESQGLWGPPAPCEYTFGRAYDLRRHLRAVHGVALDKGVVDAWAREIRS